MTRSETRASTDAVIEDEAATFARVRCEEGHCARVMFASTSTHIDRRMIESEFDARMSFVKMRASLAPDSKPACRREREPARAPFGRVGRVRDLNVPTRCAVVKLVPRYPAAPKLRLLVARSIELRAARKQRDYRTAIRVRHRRSQNADAECEPRNSGEPHFRSWSRCATLGVCVSVPSERARFRESAPAAVAKEASVERGCDASRVCAGASFTFCAPRKP